MAVHVMGLVVVSGLRAQAPESPRVVVASIDDLALEQRLVVACATLRASGKLVAATELQRQLENTPAATTAHAEVALRRTPLASADLHDLVQPSTRLVVHYYLCKECDDWHVSAASGFCVDATGLVATCAHVVAPDAETRASFLVTADLHGNVWPVERVVAVSMASDVCTLQTAERGGLPLPLRGSVRTGERVYCLSHPDHQFGFFSEGVVARQYLLREELERAIPDPGAGAAAAARPAAGGKPTFGPPTAFLHVTCDFCKGSSGAPIVDTAGNLVGIAQSTTTVVYDPEATPVDTQMVFKSATPAAALQALLRPVGAAAK
ncbi:MAG: trypsin-like peptidase domain-containing protein [Planctomycetes bacterium]|nr:trypsin-like peptidase domain-containing protein [Planctomycetota bacterium]